MMLIKVIIGMKFSLQFVVVTVNRYSLFLKHVYLLSYLFQLNLKNLNWSFLLTINYFLLITSLSLKAQSILSGILTFGLPSLHLGLLD